MTHRVIARAPGKLFVLGEYAVLDGCPAVVAAIDRVVEVTVESRRAGRGIRLDATVGCAEYSHINQLPDSGPWRFVAGALRAALYVCPGLAARHISITIASALDHGPGTKLGLGSSAAVTVGVIAAACAAGGTHLNDKASRHRLFALALETHRRVQGQRGSGADIAASVYGGVLLFQPRQRTAEVTSLALPANTRLLAGWSGEPSSTADLVERYRAARNGSSAARAAFVAASRTVVEEFVAGLAHDTLSSHAVLTNGDLLEQLANDLALPLMTPRLRELVAIARAHGAAAKISGAGGGDCGIALAQDSDTARRVRNAWKAAGLTALDINLTKQGVNIGFR